jgi:uncharacterized cupredoxin-like copper-binding protein
VKRALWITMLSAVVVVALAACGPSAPPTTINVTLSDFKFEPMEWTVAAGQTITMNATNEGAVEHEFVIMNAGQSAGDTFGDEDEANIFWEVEVQPGETATETFTAPAAGTYEVVCGIEGHLEAGMKGTLTVQ